MITTAAVYVKGLIVGLLIVLLIAAFVYAVCTYLAKRPDWGRVGAALIAIIGALLVLLDYT